jgi:hypothetical protein
MVNGDDASVIEILTGGSQAALITWGYSDYNSIQVSVTSKNNER